jgi:hypothetical protein
MQYNIFQYDYRLTEKKRRAAARKRSEEMVVSKKWG